MAHKGVVVDGDLRIERKNASILGDDKGIDFGQGSVRCLIRPVKRLEESDCVLKLCPLEPEPEGNRPGLKVPKSDRRVYCFLQDKFRMFGRDLLDFHAALA